MTRNCGECLMRGMELADLQAFIALGERASFVRAAAALGVATSALSNRIRGLEERLGVRLFNRTTRSVALTEAGDRLLAELRPALEGVGAAIDIVNAFRDTPAGTLRLNVASLAAHLVIAPLLGPFRARYRDINLEVVVDDGAVDIVGDHFDAGVRPMRLIERDMIALQISPPSRFLAVASPEY